MARIPKISTLSPEDISRFLNRRRWSKAFDFEIRFDELFKDILLAANEFVPSEAGSILLDDPQGKSHDRPSQKLVFISCFGEKADQLLGKTIDAGSGIAGKTYITGTSVKSDGELGNDDYYHRLDKTLGYTTESILSVPIIIEKSVCGVLELVNRKGGKAYTLREMELMKVFADYISISIQNALETKRSKEISKLDELSGLYNDRFFYYSIEQMILNLGRDYRDLSLIFFDLDHFKEVNDNHGHLAGSRTLKEMGKLLKRVVRKKNAIMARYGGDEFVIILPAVGLKDATDIAEKIRKTIEQNTFLKTKSPSGDPALNISGVITASIGVASFRDHCLAPGGIKELENQFISLADQAMYRAKAAGRNRVEIAKPTKVDGKK